MKRSRDYDDDDDDDDFNPTEKAKTDSLLIGEDLDDEQGYLKMDNADRKIWLVKLPKFLFDQWTSITEEGIDCGKLKIKNLPNSKIDVTLELDDRFSQDLPKNYKLQFTNYSPKTGVIPTNEYIFTDNGKGAGVSIEGIVHNEATLTPIFDEHYKSIIQERKINAHNAQKKTKLLDQENEKKAHRSTSNEGTSFAMQPRKKPVQEKRQRLPRGDLRSLLFTLFGEWPYWNLQGLIERTNQPQSYLKEVLSEIAEIQKRGPNNGTWRLKEEYINKKKEDIQSQGASSSEQKK